MRVLVEKCILSILAVIFLTAPAVASTVNIEPMRPKRDFHLDDTFPKYLEKFNTINDIFPGEPRNILQMESMILAQERSKNQLFQVSLEAHDMTCDHIIPSLLPDREDLLISPNSIQPIKSFEQPYIELWDIPSPDSHWYFDYPEVEIRFRDINGLQMNPIPEPSSFILTLLSGMLLLRKRSHNLYAKTHRCLNTYKF